MKHETNATTFATRNSQFAILILAYGNPLRRDDGVGWVIGERLAETLPEAVADVRVLHQLTPELAEPISRARAIIFIDATTPTARRINSASVTENPLKRVEAANPVRFNALPVAGVGFNRCPEEPGAIGGTVAAEPARRINSASATENPLKRVEDSDDPVRFNALPVAGVGFNRCPEEPGAISWSEIQPGEFTVQPFTHQVDPASLLAAARELFGQYPPAHLLTITGADFGFGEGLSAQVADAVEEVVEQIIQKVKRRYWVLDIS